MRWLGCVWLAVAATLPAQVVKVGNDPRVPLQRAMSRYSLLLRQFAADEPTLGDYAELGRRPATAIFRSERDLPAAHWVWSKPYWLLFRDGPGDMRRKPRRYGPEQAIGEPDNPQACESPTAWEPSQKDAGPEWLLLEFAHASKATQLRVRENHGGGAIDRVVLFDVRGREVEVWRHGVTGDTPQLPGWFEIDLPGILTARVQLHLRTERVPGWNQIDAVGLVDDRQVTHWAAAAEASSTYADVEAAAVGNAAAPQSK